MIGSAEVVRDLAKLHSREDLREVRDSIQFARRDIDKRVVSLCSGSGCAAYGTAKVHQALLDELARQGMEDDVEVKLTGCHGFCEKGPIMVIRPEGIFYAQVKEESIPEIVQKTIKNREIVDSLIFEDPATGEKIIYEQAGYLHVLDPKRSESERLAIGVAADAGAVVVHQVAGPDSKPVPVHPVPVVLRVPREFVPYVAEE